MVTDSAVGLQGPQLDDIVRTHDQRIRFALLIVGDALLRRQHGTLTDAFLDPLAHEHAGQQQTLGIGQQRSQRDGAGTDIHRHFGKFQRARVRILAAIFQPHPYLRLPRRVLLQQTGISFTPEAQQRAGRLRYVHVHRVKLLYGGQRRGLIGSDQRTFGDQGASDTTGDR